MEEEVTLKKKRNVFDIFKSLSQTKQLEPEDEDNYEPFMTNRIFSHFAGTLFHANFMNLYPMLPKEAQMDFYLYGVPAKNRFSTWFKPPPSPDELAHIRVQTGCSNRESIWYLDLLTHLNQKKLASVSKGGITK